VTSRVKKRLRIALVLAGLLALAIPTAWLAAPGLLVVETPPPPALRAASSEPQAIADVGAGSNAVALVVLGGEPWTRPARAAEVYASLHASTVIVSGEGDCQDVRRQLEAGGVPAGVILTECKSRSTYENARFSVALLRERGVTQAVVVTSWYHSRRALACFREAAPELDFYSQPTIQPASKSRWPDRYERDRILREYAKVLYYWAVHGVNPFSG
jgi:uncharacterized SAM-binding protein YcdF (DUF218 family)